MKIGDKAPDRLGIDTDGNEIRLSDFPGKKIIIYFYPKDNTPGCTAEACSLRDNYPTLNDMGYVVIGVSKDSTQSHARFREKYGLPFILIADTDTQLCQEFGVWQKKKMAGREYMGIVRTTFILDEEGTVTEVIDKVKTKAAAEQLLQLVAESD